MSRQSRNVPTSWLLEVSPCFLRSQFRISVASAGAEPCEALAERQGGVAVEATEIRAPVGVPGADGVFISVYFLRQG